MYVVDKKSSRRCGQSTTSASKAKRKRIISYSQIIQVRGSNVSPISRLVECTSAMKEWMEQSVTGTMVTYWETSYTLVNS